MSTMSGFILDLRLYAKHVLWSGALLSSTGLADALPGVSAQALITLPELRGAHGRAISGPTQSELKRVRELVAMLAEVVMADPGRSSELTQAKARLLQAEAALDTARTRVADQQVNLHKLVGDRHVAIPVGQEWNLHPGDLPALLGDIPDHPLVQQARSRTAAAQLQAEAVKVSALPQLNWTINKSTREDAWGREQPWQTALSVNWPIFRGGAVRAAERAALQRAEAGRQELEQLRRDLEYSLRTAHQEALALFERAELYQALTQESEQIRGDFFEQWYHLGRRTLLDVLSAESDYYGNRVSAVSNRFDAYHATVRQYSSAGSLFKWLRSRQ